MALREFHWLLGLYVMGGYFLLALWAAAVHFRRTALGRGFWPVLSALQVLALVQVAASVALYGAGHRAVTGLHYLYGILAAASLVVQRGYMPGGFLRPGGGREGRWAREAYVFLLVTLVTALLYLRAFLTGRFGM